jgi:hypothetical protein
MKLKLKKKKMKCLNLNQPFRKKKEKIKIWIKNLKKCVEIANIANLKTKRTNSDSILIILLARTTISVITLL